MIDGFGGSAPSYMSQLFKASSDDFSKCTDLAEDTMVDFSILDPPDVEFESVEDPLTEVDV